MCGIAGLFNWGNREALVRMTDIQSHRGPDDQGVWEMHFANSDYVGLGSRRLAIIDLSPAGHMPMPNEDGTLWITYNGEIYNFLELRKELSGKGHSFRSNTDTEVIVHLYEEEGPNCVKQLNGMFAIGICDLRENKPVVFLARDHFGIKPLYYCWQGHRLAFASEIKALLELPGLPRRIDLTALHQYLTFLWVPDPLTLFEGILKLPAGHYAIFKDEHLTIHQYWDLTFPPADHKFDKNEHDLAAELRQRFTQSVKAQLLSDVPLGAFLSAGLDSSSIVAAMSQVCTEPIRTFTIAFPHHYRVGETTLDDTEVAARTAAHFGCRHTEIVVEPDVVNLLPKLVWHMDEPTADPAIITAYLVNREARKNVTVLLSGIGGDELFAGYRKHQAHYLAQWYQRLPSFARRKLIEPIILKLPAMRGTFLKGAVRLAKKMARSGSLLPEDRFLMDSTYFSETQKADLYVPLIAQQMNGSDPWSTHRAYFAHVSQSDFLNQMLYLDSKAFMVSLNLNYNDKMSMASSVEVRVPFLDWELTEWVAWNVLPQLKLNSRGVTKYILRQAMKPLLPPEVLKQKKAGFGAPADYWLANELRPMVDDLLSKSRVHQRGLFNPAAVQRLIDEQRSGREDWSIQVWQLLTLEIWIQTFIDQKPDLGHHSVTG
jgi:asparagine synthase (glutamine-hydrolysing)